ncbi:hypothetical protein EB001_08915 [bacterium]|nr:hypothetical protein [bacterium]
MAIEIVKIPEPSKEDLKRAKTLFGTDNVLVWDNVKKKWKIVKEETVSVNTVTYERWKSGVTEIENTGSKGSSVPLSSRPFAETNPLLKVIEENNLQIVTDPDTGETYLAGKNNNKVYLYYGSAGVEVSDNYDKVKKAALDDLKSTGQLDAVFELLYKNKAISKDTYNTKNTLTNDFNAGFASLLSEYSKAAVAFNTTGVGQEPPNFLEYSLKLIGTGKGGEGDGFTPTRTFQDIGEAELNAFIDQIYIETIGRKPNDEQRASKFKELNKIIKKGILTTREKVGGEIQTRTTGGFDQQREGLELQEKLKAENPLEYERRQAFGFMDELQKVLGGGM